MPHIETIKPTTKARKKHKIQNTFIHTIPPKKNVCIRPLCSPQEILRLPLSPLLLHLFKKKKKKRNETKEKKQEKIKKCE